MHGLRMSKRWKWRVADKSGVECGVAAGSREPTGIWLPPWAELAVTWGWAPQNRTVGRY